MARGHAAHLRHVQSPAGQTEGTESRWRFSGQRQMFKVLTESRQQHDDCPTAARELKLQPGGRKWWCKETQITSPLWPERGRSSPDFTPALQGWSACGLLQADQPQKQHSWEQGTPRTVGGCRGEVMVKAAKWSVQPSPGLSLQVGPRSWQQPSQDSRPRA